MPRFSRGAAVFCALVIATAGIGAVSAFTLSSDCEIAEIGSHVPVTASLPETGSYAVYLFGGTADGSAIVNVGGVAVRIPVSGDVFAAGAVLDAAGSATISALVPDNSALIGASVTWVAVVVDRANNRVVAVVRTGGPIIEDAIC